MRLRFLRDAEAELIESAGYYDANTSGLGAEFLDEVERTLRIVAKYPGIGGSVIGEYRRVLTTRFPYALIYRATADEIVVVAVAHTSRSPGYWRATEPDRTPET